VRFFFCFLSRPRPVPITNERHEILTEPETTFFFRLWASAAAVSIAALNKAVLKFLRFSLWCALGVSVGFIAMIVWRPGALLR